MVTNAKIAGFQFQTNPQGQVALSMTLSATIDGLAVATAVVRQFSGAVTSRDGKTTFNMTGANSLDPEIAAIQAALSSVAAKFQAERNAYDAAHPAPTPA